MISSNDSNLIIIIIIIIIIIMIIIRKLTQKEYETNNCWVGKVIHMELCKRQ